MTTAEGCGNRLALGDLEIKCDSHQNPRHYGDDPRCSHTQDGVKIMWTGDWPMGYPIKVEARFTLADEL